MSYSFCFGPSGSGKSRLLRKLLIQKACASLKDPAEKKKKYIFIVPEQYSMQTQRELVAEHPAHVLMNIDVLSFGRLAYRVFEETGEDRRTVLDDIGKSLLLRRVASGCEKDLQVLRRGIRRPGMIDEVKSVLSEFMQYGIGREEIGEMAAYAGSHGQYALRARLQDLQVLSDSFHRAEENRFITSEETLDLLARAVPKAGSLKGSVLVFDGFTGFTTVQYRVVLALLRCAEEAVFSLTAGEDRGPDLVRTAAGETCGNEEDLFYLSRRTAYDIIRMASAEKIPRGRDIFMPGAPHRFSARPVLAHLERHLFRYPQAPFSEEKPGETDASLHLFAASTPQEEVRQIFRYVQERIAATGCAYRDFAIVTADLETYGDLFALEADRSGIPVYIDRTSGAFHNILTEGIRSVLQISSENFSYASVFRYLRSGLSRLTEEEADRLENYCLAHGIRGRKKWSAPFDAGCEEARRKFLREVQPVTGLEEEKGAAPQRPRTAAVRTRELYAFLENCGAQARMAKLESDFADAGDVVRQKQYGQIYRAVIDLLDQVYSLAGEERMGAREYLELLEAGFAQIRLGTLPQRVDRVLVGDMERTRLTQIRHLFFAGANEGSIPRSASRGGILSDMDREFLARGGRALAPTPRQQMFTQRLYLYLNMTKPSETLTVSFAKTAQDGGSLRPSYLVSMLRTLFPKLRICLPEEAPLKDRFLGRPDCMELLASHLREFVETGGRGTYCQDPRFLRDFALLYGFHTSPEVMADPAVRESVQRLKRAALYRYRPELLQAGTAAALYGNRVRGGISRMETGAKCLLRQHLRYGLHLLERDTYEYGAVDGGTILHAALQRFDTMLRESGLTWRTFTASDARALTRSALQEEAAAYRELLLYRTSRDENRLGRFERRLLCTVDTLQYQIRQGDLSPAAAELQFGELGGEPGQMPEIRFELGGGRQLVLAGRIDRLDLLEQNGRRFVRIMDYKSGANDLDPGLIRRGLQLQLISYMEAIRAAGPEKLDAILAASGGAGSGAGHAAPDAAGHLRPSFTEEGETVPSAMLYYRIDDPVVMLDAQAALSAQAAPDDVARRIRSALRPTGLCLLDEESISHLDRFTSGRSDAIPVTRKADGGFAAVSRLLDGRQYQELADAAGKALCRIANSILDGDVTAAPAQIDRQRSACDYCPYRDACGFDPRTPGYSKNYG